LRNKIFILFLSSLCLFFFSAGCTSRQDIAEEKEVERILSFKKELSQAQAEEDNGDLLLARKHYREILSKVTTSEDIKAIDKRIEKLNLKILFSDIVEKGDLLYEVQKGDNLGEIASRFGTTVELIKRANGLTSDMIKVGDVLKISQADFSVAVDKSQNVLLLKRNGEIIKKYVVSTGKDNSTPVGTFKIVTKLKDPTWFRKDIGVIVPPDSPDNILGSRWLGFDLSGYGIHGTTDPKSLGSHETKGCVRMKNEDVEEIFAILPRGSQVTIVD
jgi:LysM repeat protein